MIRYHINSEKRLLTVRYIGEVSTSEWKEAINTAMAECPDVMTYDSLNDFRGQVTYLSSTEVMNWVATVKMQGMADHRRRSIMLVGHKVVFGLARMFELMSDSDQTVERFTTDSVAEAAKKLGHSEEFVEQELKALEAN